MAITGASAVSNVSKGVAVVGAVAGAVGGISKMASTISAAGQGGNIGAAIRAIDLPSAGEIAGDIYAAVAAFNGLEGNNEWRVRLSLPSWPSFRTSVVLKPLKDAGGLIFPYTPEIQTSNIAKYQPLNLAHTNYNYQAYQHSEPGTITITAPMNVEDESQGLYWIAALHYLRSLTKMFTGIDPKAGNPPPIVQLNGYGQYMFSNVPVVVTNFQTTFGKDCDYIGVNVVGSAAGVAQGLADSIGGLADALGGSIPGVAPITSGPFGISDIASGVGQVAALAGLFGLGGSVAGGTTHVPTKSTFTVTLQPMYARNTAQRFSLDRFVEGGYLNSGTGFI